MKQLSQTISVNHILNVYHKKTYKWFDNIYDLNVGGIRSDERKAGSFDDLFYCAYKSLDNMWCLHLFPGTTDPGSYYLSGM